MECRMTEERGGWTGGSDRAAAPIDSPGVVTDGSNSGVVEQSDLSQDSFEGNGTSQFEIRVGDGAIGVVLGDKCSHDIQGPCLPLS